MRLPEFEKLYSNSKSYKCVYTIYNDGKILVEIDTRMITPQIYLYTLEEKYCWNFDKDGYQSMCKMFEIEKNKLEV